jgi:glyoxylase-like metal-dependent hydrolase (beta-lactamase superfamily II)
VVRTPLTADPQRNRESIRQIAALQPRLIGFGHGPALRDPTPLLDLAERLAR